MIRILYIEDNEDNIFLFRRQLARRGYEVAIARNGEAGIAMARSEQPTVILMDLDLPIVNGWEATRRLKAAPQTAGIPIIAVSSYAMVQDRHKALAAGCDDFFAKPVDMGALCARIETLTGSGAGGPAENAN